jgi:hypothetical protein
MPFLMQQTVWEDINFYILLYNGLDIQERLSLYFIHPEASSYQNDMKLILSVS